MENNNNNDRSHWNKKDIIDLKEKFEKASQSGKSERKIAEELGVPQGTWREWKKVKTSSDLPQSVIHFFNTSDGFYFLHRLITSITFVMTEIGKKGIRIAELIFEMAQIDKLAACSYGKLQQDLVIMENEIIAFGEVEQERLSKDMPKKKITVVKDETEQKGRPHLTAIEPVSNFILTEQCSDKRDAESWNKGIQEGISGLNVEIIQSTSDEGTAIKKYREDHLKDAHHSPDLFHIQSDVHKATAGPLSSKQRKYERARKKAQNRLFQEMQKKKRLEKKAKSKSVDNKMNKISKVISNDEKSLKNIQDKIEEIANWKSKISQAIATISKIYHPYDLKTGSARTTSEINDCLEQQFSEITSVAKAMGLSQKSVDRIEKSHKMVPQMVTTVAFYFNTIDAMIEEQTLDPNSENLVRSKLIPIQFLKIVSEKMQKAEDKHAVAAIYKSMIEKLENDLTWLSLPNDEKLRLENFSKECAVIFQRSSSCVEGRNSHLGLWYHGVNHLSERKRKAIRIVHNYSIQRRDHTTAAERFFGKKPRDLFLHLLEKMPSPERPRNRSVAANDEGFAMAI